MEENNRKIEEAQKKLAEERLAMVEQQRLMEEERQRMRKEHEKRVKEEQKKILGKNNSRPKLSFTLKPVTWVCLISCSFTCDIYTSCRFFGIVCIPQEQSSYAAPYVGTEITQQQDPKLTRMYLRWSPKSGNAEESSYSIVTIARNVRIE